MDQDDLMLPAGLILLQFSVVRNMPLASLKSGDMCNEKKSPGKFVMKASHWPTRIENDLKKTKIFVGNFIPCTDGLDRPFNY